MEINTKGIAKDWFAGYFGIDVRTLAVTRIAVGICLLTDCIIRLQDVAVFYTDAGVLPRFGLDIYGLRNLPYWSLHFLTGNFWVALVLLLVSLFSSICIIAGYRTAIFTFIGWLLTVSIQNRNPMVLQGCDQVLRLVLFWGIFLPWGRYYSVDAVRTGRIAYPGQKLTSIATFAFMMQVAWIYLFSAIVKSHGADWEVDGSAIYYALSIDELAKPLAHFFLKYPGFLRFCTYAVLRLEYVIPLLFFLPFFIAEARLIAIILVMILHLFLGLSLLLGPFPIFNILVSLVFLPTLFWDGFLKFLEKIKAGTQFSGLSIKIARSLAFGTYCESTGRRPKFMAFILDAFCGAAFVFALAFNITELPSSEYMLKKWETNTCYFLRIDQNWELFGPNPMRDDGWFIVDATLEDGSRVDLWHEGKPVTFAKPAYVIDDYKNFRWQKYMRRIWSRFGEPMRPYLLNYLADKWNSVHPPDKWVKSAGLIFMLEYTKYPPEKTVAKPQYLHLMSFVYTKKK